MKKGHGAKGDATSIATASPQVAAAMRLARVKRTDHRGLLPLIEARRFLASIDVFRRGNTKPGDSRVYESDRVWAALLSLENAEEFVRHAKRITWRFSGRSRETTAVVERYGNGVIDWIESRLRGDSTLVNVPWCITSCLLAIETRAALELALRVTSVSDVPSDQDESNVPSVAKKLRTITDDDDDDDDDAAEDPSAEDDEDPASEEIEQTDDLDLARRWITRHPNFYGQLAKLAFSGHARAEALLRDRAEVLGGALREAIEQSLGFAEAERYTEHFGLPRTRLPEQLERIIANAETVDEPRGPVWTIVELDDAARREQIPLWDSPTYTTAAMRVTGYASRHGDVLVFEQIVHQPGAECPVKWEAFAYGPGAKKRHAEDDLITLATDGLENVEIGDGDYVEGLTGHVVLLGERDEQGKPIAGSDNPRIVPLPFPADEQVVHVKRALTRTRGEELRVNAKLARSFGATNSIVRDRLRLVTPAEAFVVDLSKRHKRLLFATDRDLRTVLGVHSSAPRLFCFDDLEYVSSNQLPSTSKDLVLMVEALRARRRITHLPGDANTSAEKWLVQCAEARSYAAGDAWAQNDEPFELEAPADGRGVTPYWSVAFARGYPHGVSLLHAPAHNKKGQAEQAMLHLVGEDKHPLRMLWPRRTACMWVRLCAMAERKWATMDRGIAAAMKNDRMLHVAEARRLVENFVQRSWNVPARVGPDFVLLLEALIGGAETIDAFTLALESLSLDAWEQDRPALARGLFELGFVLRRTDGFVGAATNRLRALLPRSRSGETIRQLDLALHGRAAAERHARAEHEYAHVFDAPEWAAEKLRDPHTAPSLPDAFLASVAGDPMLAKYEKRWVDVPHATSMACQLCRLASPRVVPMVLGLYIAHPEARAALSSALFDRPNLRAELASCSRGAQAKVAKALLSALDEQEERIEAKNMRLDDLESAGDEEFEDEFDDDE